MAITDLFSTSFLFSVAIIIILIGGIFAYVSYRMAEQDHKLTSMVNLVSILAQDLRFVKSKLVILEDTGNTNNLQYSSDMMGGEEKYDLISVSDGDDEEDDIEDDIEDDQDVEDDGTTTCEDDDSCVSEDEEEEEDINDSQEQIKLLNLTLANEDIDNDSPIEDLGGDFEPSDTHHSTSDIKTIHLENPITFEETEILIPLESEQTETLGDDLLNLKNVVITDLGETEDLHTSKLEYKKMSLNKLREAVVSKGVVADASKLKKNDILKLLGDE